MKLNSSTSGSQTKALDPKVHLKEYDWVTKDYAVTISINKKYKYNKIKIANN